MPTTPEEYLAKAEGALADLAEAKTESERQRLKRAHGAYLKLASHGAEAAERAAMRPQSRIVPEKQRVAPPPRVQGWTLK